MEEGEEERTSVYIQSNSYWSAEKFQKSSEISEEQTNWLWRDKDLEFLLVKLLKLQQDEEVETYENISG